MAFTVNNPLFLESFKLMYNAGNNVSKRIPDER